MAPSSVVVTIEKPSNFSLVEITGFPEKEKVASPKQFTWVLLLKVHRALSCVSWLATGSWAVFVAAKKRLVLSETKEGEPRNRGRLHRFIRAFLFFSVVALFMEVIAHFKKWNLNLIPPLEVQGLVRWSYMAWLSFRADYIAPLVIMLSRFCIVLFLIQSLDRLFLCIGCFWIKHKKLKPQVDADAYDIEDASSFPMVLVQIPMCNEKEVRTPHLHFRFSSNFLGEREVKFYWEIVQVYAQSISAASQLDWPRERLLIQVLDDSDDENVQLLIKDEVSSWKQKGVNIIYRHRFVRTGYKAGNLKSAMTCDYVKDYEFVAILDADFQPNPDFLKQTIPHFKVLECSGIGNSLLLNSMIDLHHKSVHLQGNPELGLVQARWSFVNKDENLLTRLQNINLCFHFEVEQQVNGLFLNFFGFNGTAGVWRIKALEESGGWLERTTVEDMDIAVRAHLHGWKFIFLNDVKVPCELPESYEAYKKQQHRWHSGPMQLFRLCFPAIITSKVSIATKVPIVQKLIFQKVHYFLR